MKNIEIYQQTILNHSKNPENFKILQPCTHHSKSSNPLCGDKVEIYSNINNDDVMKNITFQGVGCAISIASASILTKVLANKKLKDTQIILVNFINMVENKKFNFNNISESEKRLLMTFSEIKKFPMRSKCATMCWSTFQDALNCDNVEFK
ncbi:MAG: SUF system NifU family Fe-S cluster assembly protein [Pelagibacteraceae bacterium TMED136]|nr:MAG: SUF system NifU family Fe-S cluster assembly protein [Pelagibacteraceae bacterium TMED136]|tara:strand:+ start:926 stop:1378 length:453 start_codon:yes stop_codon:yes gene_type:complete